MCAETSRETGFQACADIMTANRSGTRRHRVRLFVWDEEINYDSENELGGGVDELQTSGANPALNKSKDAHYKKADSIADPGFKAAQQSVWHLKKKSSPKPKVSLMQQ